MSLDRQQATKMSQKILKENLQKIKKLVTFFVSHSPLILLCASREQFTVTYVYLIGTTTTVRESNNNKIKAIRALTLDHVWVVNFFKCMLRRRSTASSSSSSLNDVDCMHAPSVKSLNREVGKCLRLQQLLLQSTYVNILRK